MKSFFGFGSLEPGEGPEGESPRDDDRRNTPRERQMDALIKRANDPNATPEERAAARWEIEQEAHAVLPGERRTGRRVWLEGEGVQPGRTNDRDVNSKGALRDAVGNASAQFSEQLAKFLGKR